MRKIRTPMSARLLMTGIVLATFTALAWLCRSTGHPMDEPCALAGAFWVACVMWS